MSSLLFLLLTAVSAPPEARPHTVSMPLNDAAPVVITQGVRTVRVYADRLEVNYEGVPAVFVWTIRDGAAPAPNPNPNPNPPTPPPAPDPAPVPVVTGKLWGVLVLPAEPTPAQAGMRTDQALKNEFKARDSELWSYLSNESELQTPGWQAALTDAKGNTLVPCVVWLDSTKKVVKVTATPTEASILADLKALKGK